MSLITKATKKKKNIIGMFIHLCIKKITRGLLRLLIFKIERLLLLCNQVGRLIVLIAFRECKHPRDLIQRTKLKWFCRLNKEMNR